MIYRLSVKISINFELIDNNSKIKNNRMQFEKNEKNYKDSKAKIGFLLFLKVSLQKTQKHKIRKDIEDRF